MPFFRLSGKPPGRGAIALVDSPTTPGPAKGPRVTETLLGSLLDESPGRRDQKNKRKQKNNEEDQEGQETPESHPDDNYFSSGLSSTVVSPGHDDAFATPSSPPPPLAEGLRKPNNNNTNTDRARADSLGFSPIRHIATTYRIRSSRPKKYDYGLLATDEEPERGSSEDNYSDTYFVDEDTLVSQDPHGRDRRRRWMVCGMVCGLTLLAVLLILNVLVYASRAVYAADPDPDEIFSDWGLAGTGTDGLAWYPTDFLRDVVPIPCHSHNDYWRKVPLFSALHAGCVGTEADVWLVNDDLLVGHERSALTANRTFQSLYVDPLIKILERANPDTAFYNGSSSSSSAQAVAPRGVFDTMPNQTLILMVDVKTTGESTFRKVLEQVEPLRQRGWLSTFQDGQVHYGPVTLVGSGNTPFDVVIENGTYRYAFFDAPLNALENSVYDMTNSYYASVSLGRGVGQVWFGALRRGQLRHMRYQLQQAHARGLKARYWSLPAWPINVRNVVWETLVSEGVDLLNVDDIKAAAHADWTKSSWL